MDIDNVTTGQVKEPVATFGGSTRQSKPVFASQYIGKAVIIRTYSAGVWFGTLKEKSRNEVILSDARRMWRWKAAESISLSGVAVFGIDRENSKIAPCVESVWLEAIEIIPTTPTATVSIQGADDVKAE